MIDGDELFNKVLKDFEEHGASTIERLAKENPVAFLWLAAAVVCDDVHEYVEG
jgi:hypothetical protein